MTALTSSRSEEYAIAYYEWRTGRGDKVWDMLEVEAASGDALQGILATFRAIDDLLELSSILERSKN